MFRRYRDAAVGSQVKIQIRQMSRYLFHMPGFFCQCNRLSRALSSHLE